MRNQDRMPPPYVLGVNTSGSLTAAGLALGNSSLDSGSTVCIKTNGGIVVSMPAPNASAVEPTEEEEEE